MPPAPWYGLDETSVQFRHTAKRFGLEQLEQTTREFLVLSRFALRVLLPQAADDDDSFIRTMTD